jgi:hypothetical protein
MNYNYLHYYVFISYLKILKEPAQRRWNSDEDKGCISKESWLDSRQRQEIYVFFKAPRPAVKPNQPFKRYRKLSQGKERREDENSAPMKCRI